MRKFVAIIAAFGLLTSGCSWFGWGDDSSSTAAEIQDTPAATQPEATPAQQAPAKPAKAQASTKTPKGSKSEAQIKAELDQMGKKLAAQSSRTIVPNKNNKDIKQVGGQWVVSYIDVRPEEVTTQLRKGASGQYVGSIRYAEHFMECRGATRQEALKAPCQEVKSRNLNELIRYDGKQWQD